MRVAADLRRPRCACTPRGGARRNYVAADSAGQGPRHRSAPPIIPAGPPWSMVGPYDFDNDGYGDFIVSSSYSGEFCNGVYHYEAFDDDSIALNWVYTFWNLSCTYDNYSSVAVGDLDQDGLLEIIALVDTDPDSNRQHGLQIFEWSVDSMSFLSTPTATWDMGLYNVFALSVKKARDYFQFFPFPVFPRNKKRCYVLQLTSKKQKNNT